MALWAAHGVNTYDSKVGSVGTPTVVLLTGLEMLLEIHTAEFPEGLVKADSPGQPKLTEAGGQRQRSPRAPAGAARRQPQRGERGEPGPGRAGQQSQPCPAAPSAPELCYKHSQLWPAPLASLGN